MLVPSESRVMQVRQHDVPAGKHALISVKQPRGQLVAIRARSASQAESAPRELRLWKDCDEVQVRGGPARRIGLASRAYKFQATEAGGSGRT